MITTPNALYTGLTIAQLNSKNFLYAANFANHSVDVFNASFQPISLGTGAFQNSMVPSGFAPFNVQNIGGAVYVTFAEVGPDGKSVAGAGLGYVDKFSAAGKLLMRLEHGNWINAPWGLVAAPATGFGPLSGQLLVGNFGSGAVLAFNPTTGVLTATMKNSSGKPLLIPVPVGHPLRQRRFGRPRQYSVFCRRAIQ